MSKPRFHDGSSRGKVVMLVDNPVQFDSRVQKQARSMAERGWDVVLLGSWSKSTPEPRSWSLGDANVWLISVPSPMAPRKHEYRSPLWRDPLAYRSLKRSAYRTQQVLAQTTDLRFRIDSRRVAGNGALGILLLRARLLVRKTLSRWVRLRSEHTQSVRQRRVAMVSPIDRFTTWWWGAILGDGSWRKLDPQLWDWELAFGPVVDRLAPDLIHANDFRMLSIGARAATRAKARGRNVRLVWDAHEFLPGIKPWRDHPRWHRAQCALEREFAPFADAVVTVTEPLAELLVVEHGLLTPPSVVLNAPTTESGEPTDPVADIRTMCGLPDDVALLVYSGVATPHRGLDVMVEALERMPGTHVALVVNSQTSNYVTGLAARAVELGVRDRLHLLPYVPVEQIVPFLSTATVGVMPALHWPNHEVSLATKFFEYSHAGLPIVVSDLKAMGDMVRSTGQGEVFVAEDLDDYVRAAEAIISDPARYRKAYEDVGQLAAWSWEPQADVLDGVYRGVMGELR